MNARTIALTSIFTALGITLRLLKHALAGTIQFMNAPLFSAMVAGYVAGPFSGALTGVLSFTLSDALIMLGPWTPINAVLAGIIGASWGLLKGEYRNSTIFISAFFSEFLYDILSSFALYAVFLKDPLIALVYSLVGLYMPVMGGYLIAVGPITEFVTAGLTTLVVNRLKKLGVTGRVVP